MSWSISYIGTPEKIAKAMDEQSEKMDGQSKVELDSALPHLKGLLNENFGNGALIKLMASGHGYAVDGMQKNRQCTVSIEVFYSTVLI